MNADEFLPDAETVAAIEKDIATYNGRRAVEHADLLRKRPAMTVIYVVATAVLTYLAWLAFGTSNAALIFFVPAAAVGFWGHFRKWIERDATWTQQNFRDHMVPVMLGFVPGLRYAHGIRPRCFDRIPKALLPTHNHVAFDDTVSGTLSGLGFELSEVRLEQRSKNSSVIVFQGVILNCRRREPFPGVMVATRRVGDFRRFLRDLFGTDGLGEIAVGEHGLGDLYEFRTDRRREARALLTGGLAELLVWMSKQWRADVVQLALSGDDVFLMLPTPNDYFALPPIDREVSYRSHIEPMARQFSRFLAIVDEVRKLDAEEQPAAAAAQVEAAPQGPEEAPAAPPPDDRPFIPLLGGDDPPPEAAVSNPRAGDDEGSAPVAPG